MKHKEKAEMNVLREGEQKFCLSLCPLQLTIQSLQVEDAPEIFVDLMNE